MKREYVAVDFGDGRQYLDEIVNSCVASSRQVAERKLNGDLYVVMTRRQAEARGIPDLRERTRFCR